MKNIATNTLGYTGIVTLSQYINSKKIKIAQVHNEGSYPLFNFLSDCLLGDFSIAALALPNKIMLLKKDDNDYTAYLVPSFLSVCCVYLNKKQRHSVDAIKYESIKNKDGFCYVILDKSYTEFFDDGEIVGV